MKQTRQNIIEAARVLFEQKGFAAATTREIAERAGVSEVTLFRHFANKRALFDQTAHSCLHPYKIDHYLKEKVSYDLKRDLTQIACDMKDTFCRNAPMLRMVMRDKIRQSAPEMEMRQKEHHVHNNLLAYFETMRSKGRLSADPQMALKFFVTNITGFLMKELVAQTSESLDETYFSWMLDQVIAVLQNGTGKDTLC